MGFNAGADDYLSKTFETRELLIRVKAPLSRQATVNSGVLRFADLELDPVKYTFRKAGQRLHLAPIDFALLEFFMRHPDETFTSEQLIIRVWDFDGDATNESLRVAIRRIRKVIDTCDSPQDSLIETITRVGYRLRNQRS